MKQMCRLILSTVVPAACSPAFAQFPPPIPQLPFYVGAGIGGGHLNRSGTDFTGLNNVQLDSSDTSYTLRTGYRFSPFGAVELGYYDLGRYNFSGGVGGTAQSVSGSARAQSVGLSLVGILPYNNFDLYGRIGIAQSKLKFNANGPLGGVANDNEHQTEATYGVGGRWTFLPNWALFVEWMKNDRIRVDSYTGGLDFRF
jgi:OOP family OmpA-OmpF porin